MAAPGDPGKDYVYPFKTYPEEEKRSDPAKDYVYPFKTYPEDEKRAATQVSASIDKLHSFMIGGEGRI